MRELNQQKQNHFKNLNVGNILPFFKTRKRKTILPRTLNEQFVSGVLTSPRVHLSIEASKWFQWRHNTARNQANRLLSRVITSFSQTRIFDLETNWQQTVADRVIHSFSKQRYTLNTTRVGITRVSFVIREVAFTYFPIITKLRTLISEFAWLKHCCYCKETSFFAPQFTPFRFWTRCQELLV